MPYSMTFTLLGFYFAIFLLEVVIVSSNVQLAWCHLTWSHDEFYVQLVGYCLAWGH